MKAYKKRSRISAIILCLAMLVPFVSTKALAAPAGTIKLRNQNGQEIILTDGDYLPSNDATAAVSGYTHQNYVARCKGNTLYLNGYKGNVNSTGPQYVIYSDSDLTIEVESGSELTIGENADSCRTGIIAAGQQDGIGYGKIRINGPGKLVITSRTFLDYAIGGLMGVTISAPLEINASKPLTGIYAENGNIYLYEGDKKLSVANGVGIKAAKGNIDIKGKLDIATVFKPFVTSCGIYSQGGGIIALDGADVSINSSNCMKIEGGDNESDIMMLDSTLTLDGTYGLHDSDAYLMETSNGSVWISDSTVKSKGGKGAINAGDNVEILNSDVDLLNSKKDAQPVIKTKDNADNVIDLSRGGVVKLTKQDGQFADPKNAKLFGGTIDLGSSTKCTAGMEEAGNKVFIAKNDPEGSTTYVLKFEKGMPAVTTHTVTFHPNNGDTDIEKTVSGDVALQAPVVARDGYTLEGWYTDPELTQKFDFLQAITGDLHLYAKWIAAGHTVTFDVKGHGTAPAAQVVENGKTATKPQDPVTEGYTFLGWYADETYTTQFDFVTQILYDMTLYAKWEKTSDNPSKNMVDVDQNSWYKPAVDYVLAENLMKGVSETKFAPNASTTRGMIVTILYRVESEPPVAGDVTFKDVAKGLWYEKSVVWAQKESIVAGYSNTAFGPMDNITREQMASILYRYAKYKGIDVSKTTNLGAFTDANKVSPYARDAMQWAVAEGLLQGVGDSQLAPQQGATRAQVATILMRFLES